MKLLACSIFDKQVNGYMPVFFVRAKGEAMRHFMDAVADKNSPFFKHPSDYHLFVLAEFDDQTGGFQWDVQTYPMPLMSGVDAASALSS